ncbi:T9SS type A sorting domain-containing protein [Dyadobacter sp. CY326]|uniref:T9SS type A sorting domain-containing protein n=1 Tax=Dyadobacter sp. CY326 TaxID=2907300 RepID=UPI001F22E769|nr:T9SS type A sorting domain-containing protein [Dyadobacter sp. CY326]MCE7066156.1 T9SS type A sorting domain-containing protein [Dyadobacter sp. CY326]
MKKALLLSVIFSLCRVFSPSFAEKIQIVNFSSLPEDLQLYPRNANNEADVTIAGNVEAAGYAYVSVVTSRNGARTSYHKNALKYTAEVGAFSIATTIKSELAEYSFAVYACKSATDSTLIVTRNNVVAGDLYLIYGQSNAVAWEVDYPYRNEFCRTFGSAPKGTGFGLANALSPRVGIFGIEFQRRVAEKYGIPTCVINGALAGASLAQLIERNPDNHEDPAKFYGVLLNYVNQSGLMPALKGIFYWQGENEAASNDPLVWAPRFEQMVNNWKEDYPKVEKIYVFQLPLFGGGAYDDRIGQFREDQRLLGEKYPIIQPYAALGAPGWNGFHYGLEGYLKLGQDLADMAGFYHYGKKEKITSPSLKKAFYSKKDSTEITMVFEDYQKMVYPNDTLNTNIEGSQEPSSIYSVKDFFYLNAEWQKLKSGRAEANKIIVEKKAAGPDSLIKYLPSKYHYAGLLSAPWVYIGPFLRNDKGFRAFAFHHNKIYPFPNLGTLTLTARDEVGNVVLSWNELPGATGYILERSGGPDSLGAHEILHLPLQATYSDPSAKQGVEYIYSIRAVTEHAESGITSIRYKKLSADVLGIEPLASSNFDVFPNPSAGEVNVVSAQGKIGMVEVFSSSGVKLKEALYDQQHWAVLNLAGISSGFYLIKIHTGSGSVVKRVAIR